MISLDGVFEIVAEQVWNTDILLAHTVLLLLVSGGGFYFPDTLSTSSDAARRKFAAIALC
ncbi:MAG: hypothetical protein M0C28_31795 [Candidatus Moduliflexus flocculans]|nr:hypothetical protein [Candidatus Moduliflexus flocculans]